VSICGTLIKITANIILYYTSEMDKIFIEGGVSMPNRRRFDRVQFESQAMVKTGGQSFEASTENLSLNGLFIRTEKRLPVGNRAEVMFVLPSASRSSEISVNGAVVRYDNDGMAFQFGSLDHDSFSLLKTIINRKAQNRLKRDHSAK
jgi:hypothetical protein